ncbi:AraC family transcriptional regulator [Clostridium estertheticum]|uniref:AraC family transcriptional regulator n=1 Tax=Clostridium estertheticum TaxID=238834 RepID=A0AA47EK97_9CLOT|nr:AraC family transcriptional regulator [Clostridium estertheticum]MBU3154635.1 AraC family transcriptional regulator [Clostridium estertheticum]MBU3198780.1 AraC family transcriptional regulator [Clostridium estertheticum]WAG61783.1 AraC family transcriptional regulator [Clostridium estertheticum]WAG64094.1 AraC family transcriptional regulator [Clostridium estertheticum]
MQNETRTVCFDLDLNIEAYNFKGIMQKFPNHFHEYYVIGFIESGKRYLSCKNKEYTVKTGDLTLFNPHDNHNCKQVDGRTLDYRCINIEPDVMKKVVHEITGKEYLPYFTETVLFRSDLLSSLSELHHMIMHEEKDFKKEEIFLLIIEQLIAEYDHAGAAVTTQPPNTEIKAVCDFLENNYMKSITLNDLSDLTGISKYYLLRSFTKQKGISPYCYLETIRIGNAKKLLEQQIAPIDVALQTGFTDQSHFTNFFKKLIGLTPKQYMNIFTEGSRRSDNE